MNLPQTVTGDELARLAGPEEELAVRVMVRSTGNAGPYTLRGRFRRYIAMRDEAAGCHVLDVPLSVWMAGVPAGVYQDNLSVAHDLQASRLSNRRPLVILVVPWAGSAKDAGGGNSQVQTLNSKEEEKGGRKARG